MLGRWSTLLHDVQQGANQPIFLAFHMAFNQKENNTEKWNL
jgi:hypothetical protein